MSRHQRQRDELRELCRSGALGRAVDLAFQHLVEFGPDDELLAELAAAVDGASVPAAVRQRFADLRSVADQPAVSPGAQCPSQTR